MILCARPFWSIDWWNLTPREDFKRWNSMSFVQNFDLLWEIYEKIDFDWQNMDKKKSLGMNSLEMFYVPKSSKTSTRCWDFKSINRWISTKSFTFTYMDKALRHLSVSVKQFHMIVLPFIAEKGTILGTRMHYSWKGSLYVFKYLHGLQSRTAQRMVLTKIKIKNAKT